MISSVAKKLFGSRNERELKRIVPLVEKVNSLENNFTSLSNDALVSKTSSFKERIEKGESLDLIMPEAFSVVREASKRTLGMRHFDVQLFGGIVLHEGKIAEMKTGEGKTLCATLPVYLNALSGKGVHVVTVNDYLAKRDAEWMAQVYNFLGLEVGVIVNGMSHSERYRAYRADITYGQNNEFGFDYLRDNMKFELSDKVQREYNFAIVDEVDSILIDEARTPLIISGPSDSATEKYEIANKVALKLKDGEDYEVELKSKQVTLTESGVKRVESILNLDNLYDPLNIEMVHHVNQAVKAHATMRRDFDYVVRDNEVIIVDEFTGRLMSGRRWSDGLHQAVEAKEGVKVQRENQTLATITFQNYFRMYDKLAGMTGTADTEAVEFQKIYGLEVIVVPTNRPLQRKDFADVVYASEVGKIRAVCDEIEELNKKGQPVLVGTASIAKSELVSQYLKKRGVNHTVLNAKHHENEAGIVAQAGRIGAVTISTNMAGRGTDILLGGNPEFLAEEAAGTDDHTDPEFQEELAYYKEVCAKEKAKVLELGGLHILGTERHESRRIDNQLRGRSGRQGDPGSSRFFVSLEDDLMKRFGGERMQAIMTRVGLSEDDAIEGMMVARAIENAQKKVEGYHFDIRKHLLEYDDVMNKQREVIYNLREKVLRAEEIEQDIREMVPDIIEDVIVVRAGEKIPVVQWDVDGMFSEFYRQFGIKFNEKDFTKRQEDADKKLAQEIFEFVKKEVEEKFEKRFSILGKERFISLIRIVYLQAIDHFWKEHLLNIDHLKEGIGLRGYGQKNPLQEYQREAFEMFTAMMMSVKSAVLQNLFIPELPTVEEIQELEEREREYVRKQEEAAKTIHQDALEEADDSDLSGLNRKQRRQVKAEKAKTSSGLPSNLPKDSASKNKAKADRKKRKKG